MKIETIQLNNQNPQVTLTTYLLADSPEMLKGQSRPAVIICPGGGYFSCSDREAEPVAMAFAAQGYHAFVLNYTTYGDGGLDMPDLSKPLPVKQDRLYPHQLHDLGRAMIYVKQHAEAWHVNPDQVVVCGFSAGGHNAALYATNWDNPELAKALNVDAEQLKPCAAILGYALTDYVFLQQDIQSKSPMDISFMRASNVAFLGLEDPTPEQLEAVSPAHQVSATTPPMFIWGTANDLLVSCQHAIKMAGALATEKIPFELHIFENGPHGLSLATPATSEAKTQVFPDVAAWTTLCATWLTKHVSLPLNALSDFEKMVQSGQNH